MNTTSFADWSLVLNVGVGLGVFLMGVGIFWLCVRVAKAVTQATATLAALEQQVATLTPAVGETLAHLGGIASTADSTLTRLTSVVEAVEGLAGGVVKTANAAQDAVNPAVTNLGAVLTTLSARLRSFVGARSDV